MFKMLATDLNWNIHRDPITNPIQKPKIDALLTSFEKSKNEANPDGFWLTGLGIVLLRYEGDDENGYTYEPLTAEEVAEVITSNEPGAILALPDGVSAHLYAGHHRLEAALKAGIEELIVVPEFMDLRQMQIRYILENGEEYGQNMQVLIENTDQSRGILKAMLDSSEDYDAWVEQYGDEGKNIYSKARFSQMKGDAVISANDVVKLLGSDVSKKNIEAACKVLDDEAKGIIRREEVFNFPTARMMGIFGTVVSIINDMDAVPEAIRDFYKAHLAAEISGDLVRTSSHDTDEKYNKARQAAMNRGPRVTFSQLDGLRRNLAATKKNATESGDKFGVDVVQALKRAQGIKKEGDESVESAFSLKAALGSEKRCGVRWQDLIDKEKNVSEVEGLTDFAGAVDAIKEIDEKHLEKAAKDKEAEEKGGELQGEIDEGAVETSDELPPMEAGDAEGEVDPEQVAQEALANFSAARESIESTMLALAQLPKLISKNIEEAEHDSLEAIFVAAGKVIWATKGTRKDVDTLVNDCNPNKK